MVIRFRLLPWACRLLPFAVGLVFFTLSLALPAVATPTLEQEQEIRATFVTPHTKWAKPYAGGTTRVLFFSDYRHTQAREIVELMQRFEVQADAAYYYTIIDTKRQQWHGGEEGIARIRRLLDSGAHDVFLFNGVSPDVLPAAVKQDLLARVAQGRGLVLVGVKERRRLDPPLENDPDRVALDEPLILDAPLARRVERSDPDAELFAWQQGRVARLPAAPVADYSFGWDVSYDHWQERLGRAVLWAARKLPTQPLVLRREPAAGVGSDARSSLDSRLVVTLPADTPIAQVRIRERREDGLIVRDSLNPLPLGGGGNSSNPLPPGGGGLGWGGESSPRPPGEGSGVRAITGPPAAGLPAGRYYDEVIASDAAGRAVAWATLPFVVVSPHRVELELSRAWGEIGDTLAGKVTVAGRALEQGRVSVELRDRRGRILAATPPTAPNASGAPFSFPIPEWYPMLVQVRAVLRGAAGEVADAVAYFNVTKRHRDRFNFLSWDVPRGPTAAWAHEALARLGVTLELVNFQSNPSPVMAAYDMAAVPYTTRILAEKDDQGWIKPVPWNREPEIQRYVDDLVAKYEPARRHGVFAYSLGDETVTRGSDTSPSDLAAYRRYLQGVYGNIAALNDSWGTDYAGFEAIELLDSSDPTEEGAKRAGNYARWYDRQAWESANFLGLCRRFGEAFRRLDPQALTGFENSGFLKRGDDIDGIVRTNGFWTAPLVSADQVLRGIAPRDFPYANWMGYARDADSLTWVYWRMVLNGSHGVWWWRWENIGRFMGLLRPDLTPFDEVAAMLEDTRITREGLGALLLRSTMQTDGIALLYSQPSLYAAQVATGPSYGNAADDHAAWQRALFNLGLSFTYITDAGLRRGELDPATRVLILPRAEALGAEEVQRITAFVEAGGTVIADLRPGRFTDRVKPCTAGALDALFGVDTQDSAQARKAAKVEIQSPSGAAGSFTSIRVDPGIRATGATAGSAADSAPALLTHAVGRGRAILLNFSLADIPRIGSLQAPPDAAAWLRALLAEAGVQPAFTLEPADGGPTGDLRAQRWHNGEIELIGILLERERTPHQLDLSLGEPIESKDFVLTLPAPRWVYDLRARESCGQQTRIRIPLRTGQARFLALLPDAAPMLQATIAPTNADPGDTVELLLSVPGALGDEAVLVTAQKPDGTEADWLRTVRIIPRGGSVHLPLPIALNDPPGMWLVHLQTLFTQRVTELRLSVGEGRNRVGSKGQ